MTDITKPEESAAAAAAAAAAKKKSRPTAELDPEAGDIGDVGEHGFIGDLGTNHPEGVPNPHLPPEEEEE